MAGVDGIRLQQAARQLLLRDLVSVVYNPQCVPMPLCMVCLFVCCVCTCYVSLLEPSGSLMIGRHQISCVRYSAHGRGKPCQGVKFVFGKVDGRKSRIDGICYAPVAVWVTSGRNPQHPWGSVCAGASCVSFTVSIESTSND